MRRQQHAETRATSEPIGDLYAPAVRQDDGLADGQTEPVAGHLHLLCGPLAEEGLEYPPAILSGDAWALVVDGQLQFAVVRDPRPDTNRATWRRVLDRVLDQIAEHALHLTGIHAHCWQGRWHVQPQRSASQQSADAVECALDDRGRVDERHILTRCWFDGGARRGTCHERINEFG